MCGTFDLFIFSRSCAPTRHLPSSALIKYLRIASVRMKLLLSSQRLFVQNRYNSKPRRVRAYNRYTKVLQSSLRTEATRSCGDLCLSCARLGAARVAWDRVRVTVWEDSWPAILRPDRELLSHTRPNTRYKVGPTLAAAIGN